MHLFPVERKHGDQKQDAYSARSATVNNEPDLTRQEFKKDTDVNEILKRFDIGNFPRQQIEFGDRDFNLDLQAAYEAVEAAETAHAHLTPELRAKYPTWQDMLNAIHKGELTSVRPPEPEATPQTRDEQAAFRAFNELPPREKERYQGDWTKFMAEADDLAFARTRERPRPDKND